MRLKRVLRSKNNREPRPYRLVYNLASLFMFAWVMAAYRNSPVLYYVPGIWSLILYLIQLAVAAMLFVCVRQTGAAEFLGFRQLQAAKPSGRLLITSGWYAVSRHPLYLLSILFLILNPVMTAQWLLLTILSATYFIIGGLMEEHRLQQEFGEEYSCYQQKAPFLIPSMKRIKQRSAG